eukprot:SAG22_NODE_14_length_33165_cov_13.196698_35_plen_94_part_00
MPFLAIWLSSLLLQIATGQAFGGMVTDCQRYSAYPGLVAPFFFCFFVVGNFIFISLFIVRSDDSIVTGHTATVHLPCRCCQLLAAIAADQHWN